MYEFCFLVFCCCSGSSRCALPVDACFRPRWAFKWFSLMIYFTIIFTVSPLWIFLQVLPVKKALWWESCVVWAPWREHLGPLCHPLVKTISSVLEVYLWRSHLIVFILFFYHFFHSVLDCRSSDLLSPHSCLFCGSTYSTAQNPNTKLQKDFLKNNNVLFTTTERTSTYLSLQR